MPKLYLLGGENVYRQSARAVNARAFEDAGKPLDVLVFAWARASFDRNYLRRKRLTDYFHALGADSVDFVVYSQSTENIAEKLTTAKLAYLTGGMPSVLIERLRSTKVDRLLETFGGVVVGRSAGALALCRRCIATVRSTGRVKIVEGLGLVDLTLKVHYLPRDDVMLEHFSLQEHIYAVPEGSALLWENGAVSTVGTAYLFREGEKQALP